MNTITYGATYVGAFLNVTHSAVHNWAKKAGPDSSDPNAFPYPDVVVMGRTGTPTAFGWYAESLPKLRAWVTKRHHLSPEAAAQYWAQVDASMDLPAAPSRRSRTTDTAVADVIPGQLTFDLEGCDAQ